MNLNCFVKKFDYYRKESVAQTSNEVDSIISRGLISDSRLEHVGSKGIRMYSINGSLIL